MSARLNLELSLNASARSKGQGRRRQFPDLSKGARKAIRNERRRDRTRQKKSGKLVGSNTR